MTTTFGDLFAYLDKFIKTKTSNQPFLLVQQFSDLHGLDADSLFPVLEGYGGYDDHEVLLNVAGRIPEDTAIIQIVETPEQYAVRKGFYCKRTEAGWEECSDDDRGAMPDLNRALFEMASHRGNGSPGV